MIDALILKQDNSEVIRDQIAAILVAESASQQALAISPHDPDDWALRVFTERSNPWDEFNQDEIARQLPIVNVSLSSLDYDKRHGNVFERQKAAGTFNVDVYGWGISRATDDGHDPGDQAAALECQRAVRLVRNILMAATYAYLATPRKAEQFVWGRWIQSIQFFQPQLEDRPIQNVMAARIALQVEFNEHSPQVSGQPLERIDVTVQRAGNGQVLLVAQYP